MTPTRIDRRFADLRSRGEKGFIAYITAGDPNLDATVERVRLLERDVLAADCPPVDVVAALNFSYMVFHERERLKAYFRRVFEGLAPGGVFLLDIFGGPQSQDVMTETKKIDAGEDFEGTPYPAFTYVWDQAAFNAVDQRIRCHIHFKGKRIRPIRKAFTYDWRLWSITEVADLLREVELRDGRLVVDFDPAIRERMPGAASSAGSRALLSSLDSTAFQFPEVESAEYRLGGSCEAFWNWLQRECRIVRRR